MYQRPEQSRATVPRKKSAWPKALPVRLSAVVYKAVLKCRQGRSPKKGLPSLALGRALPASAPRGLLPPAPYASAHGAGRYSTKKAAPERCPARKPGRNPVSAQAERTHHTREGTGNTEKCCEASIQEQLRAVQRFSTVEVTKFVQNCGFWHQAAL